MDEQASDRRNAIDDEHRRTEDELDAIAHRVRAGQRRNFLVKVVAGCFPILGMGVGIWLQTLDAWSMRGAFWLGLIVGTAVGVAILKKFEVVIEDLA